MKKKAQLFCLLLLVATMAMTPGSALSLDLSIPFDDRAFQIIEQIQDLELMGRNIQRCYEAEKRTSMSASLSGQTSADSTRFNGELVNRVFGYLVGTPEHGRFVEVYRELIRYPGYKKNCAANLYAEYIRLIKSARTRLTAELKERLRILVIESSAEFSASRELPESNPVNIVSRQYPGRAKSARKEARNLTIIEESQMPLTGHGKGKDLLKSRP
jgi:hypothetical protein